VEDQRHGQGGAVPLREGLGLCQDEAREVEGIIPPPGGLREDDRIRRDGREMVLFRRHVVLDCKTTASIKLLIRIVFSCAVGADIAATADSSAFSLRGIPQPKSNGFVSASQPTACTPLASRCRR